MKVKTESEYNDYPDWLFKLYRFKSGYLRKIIRKLMLRRLVDEFYSKTLRKIYSEYHGIDIGMYTYYAFHCLLPPGTKIGRYSSCDLHIYNGSHPITQKSSHPLSLNQDLGYVDKLPIQKRTKLIVGNDVYTGFNVTIMPNVTNIGDGAVIAFGSVVVEDVPPYAVIGGNPAKLIKYRFKPETIQRIIDSRWWDKNIEDIKKNKEEFESFLHPLE